MAAAPGHKQGQQENQDWRLAAPVSRWHRRGFLLDRAVAPPRVPVTATARQRWPVQARLEGADVLDGSDYLRRRALTAAGAAADFLSPGRVDGGRRVGTTLRRRRGRRVGNFEDDL